MKHTQSFKIIAAAAGFCLAAACCVFTGNGKNAEAVYLCGDGETAREAAKETAKKTGREEAQGAMRETGREEALFSDAAFQAELREMVRAEIAAALSGMQNKSSAGTAYPVQNEVSAEIPPEALPEVPAKAPSKASVAEAVPSAKININTAGKEELMTLKGIGEAKAEAIILYRETCGAFAYPEEIMNISGIKENAYAKIRDDITV